MTCRDGKGGTCRSAWCRIMLSALLTLGTVWAALGDSAACCWSLCSISYRTQNPNRKKISDIFSWWCASCVWIWILAISEPAPVAVPWQRHFSDGWCVQPLGPSSDWRSCTAHTGCGRFSPASSGGWSQSCTGRRRTAPCVIANPSFYLPQHTKATESCFLLCFK